MNPTNSNFERLNSILDQLGKIDLKKEKGIFYDESKNEITVVHSKWGILSSEWGSDSENALTSSTFHKINELLNEFIDQAAGTSSLKEMERQASNVQLINSQLKVLKENLKDVTDSSGNIERLIDASNRLAMMAQQTFPPLPTTPPPPLPKSPPPPLPGSEEKK